MTTEPAVDEAKLNEFVGKFAGDLGAVLHAATVLIGDKLGLYKAMADSEPVERTGTDERYMREWLSAQAASGYVEYDPASDRFRLPAEQAFALTNEYNPLFVPGGLQTAASTIKDVDNVAEAIRMGRGVGWHEHHHDLYEGTERFFRPNYIGNLVSSWIPALEGVEDKLRVGAKVADVGCGHGSSVIIEPFANDRLEDNLNPVGRIFYSASTVICVPASKDQEVGLALGAQAGEARMREIVTAGGFSRFRRATETPFNLVLEARP